MLRRVILLAFSSVALPLLAGSKEDHWSFRTPRRASLPAVQRGEWVRNDIDRFVLARLEAAGLAPSAIADRVTLARRVSLDLRGLPPTITEMDRFLADERPGAYERFVELMLASPRYGERMAQDWLDLARYGDTNGFHGDSDRSMWLYRDYVIESFNEDLPYDRFITENLAGDLLPKATDRTRIASGFNRCNTFNEEGGADPDEFYVAYAVDRTNTMGQVFLGLTLGCAQCHDHKFDPISQREYYQFYAFFSGVEGEIGAGGQSGYHNKPLPPLLRTASSGQRRELESLERRRASVESTIESQFALADLRIEGELEAEFRAWQSGRRPTRRELEVKAGLELWLDAEKPNADGAAPAERLASWADRSGKGRHAAATGRPQWVREAIGGRPGVRLDGVNDFLRSPRGGEALRGDFTAVVVAQMTKLDNNQMLLMWGEEANGKRRSIWKVAGKNQLSFNGYNRDLVASQAVDAKRPFVAGISKEGADHRVRVFLNGQVTGDEKIGLVPFAKNAITIGANNAGAEKSSVVISEVLVYSRALDATERDSIGQYLESKYGIASGRASLSAAVARAFDRAESERSAAERRVLERYFLRRVSAKTRDHFARLDAELAEVTARHEKLRSSMPTTMVMVEPKKRPESFVLMRGDFRAKGDKVVADVPSIFPRLAAEAPRSRLGLASWLTDPRHPLVSRVVVNRLWKRFFGTGLVKTLGDFGTQGERPSHPKLLDYLAVEFIDRGWSVKKLTKSILLSATYRQASVHHGRYDEVDPENRLLWRAARFRLSAEEIRDVSLRICGSLTHRIGGPSVKPFQPASYYSDKVGRSWNPSSGADYYRRGLYTYWRRTTLYPAFQIFDAPSREVCTVDRPRTNTPLQALVTMNDRSYVEAARLLAQRVLLASDSNDERLSLAMRYATGRRPSSEELSVLRSALRDELAFYKQDTAAAKKLISIGQRKPRPGLDAATLAAWTVVGSIILNLDETLTRE